MNIVIANRHIWLFDRNLTQRRPVLPVEDFDLVVLGESHIAGLRLIVGHLTSMVPTPGPTPPLEPPNKP